MRQESLLIFDQTVPYSVRVSDRAQRLRVAVYADGSVVVTKPQQTTHEMMKHFVETKKIWIHKKLETNQTSPVPELQESSPEHFKAHKLEAFILARNKVKQWNQVYGFDYGDILIKPLKSRWGSCSSNGDLSFNYKLLFLPEKLQDYVIVHELCHLGQPNHSMGFWKLISKALPDYTELKKVIRTI